MRWFIKSMKREKRRELRMEFVETLKVNKGGGRGIFKGDWKEWLEK